jgi:ribonuclease P protein component
MAMLPKQLRFPLRQSKTFFHDARRVVSPPFLIYYQENSAGATAQAAVIVPKKVSKKAVERNRLKRIVHQELSSTLPFLQSYSLVVYITRHFEASALPILNTALNKFKKKS